jgi:hypothetical protein
MTRTFFILLVLSFGQILGQKADTAKFDKIFGTNCPDSISHPTDKLKTYIIQWKDHESYITSYKSKKKKWSVKIDDLVYVGDNYINIKCIEFYEVNKKLVLRLFLDTYLKRDAKLIYHLDIDPKNGKLVDKELAKK